MNPPEKEYLCDWCGTSSVSLNSLKRHQTSCSEKDTLSLLRSITEELDDSVKVPSASACALMSKRDLLHFLSVVVSRRKKDLRHDVSKSGGDSTGPHVGSMTNGIVGSVVNSNVGCVTHVSGDVVYNITLDFGSEKLGLSLEELEKLLRVHPVKAVSDFVEKTHFTTESGMNWFISNLKDRRARVFDGSNWVSKKADEVVYCVFDRHRNVIDETCEQALEQDLTENVQLAQRVKKWEKESSKPDFEDLCQERVSTLGYENKAKVVQKTRRGQGRSRKH